MSMVCPVGQHTTAGFTNLGVGTSEQWWVCGECRRPKEDWLKFKGDDVLNFFRGGHLDGLAYATTDLLKPNATSLRVDQYQWTPEVLVGEQSGKQARVWVFVESENGGTS